MGKTKQKRKSHRNRPTGLPSVLEVEKELLEESPALYQSVIERLQSKNGEDRESAACTVANLAGQPEALAALMEADVVQILGPLLLDRSLLVRNAATGALRNLSVAGYEVCREMVERDVLTPLVALLRQYSEGRLPAKSAESKIDSKKETFFEAVNLLWNLCENSQIALDVFAREQLLPIFLTCLNVVNFDIKICIAVAQCLNTVSEGNSEIIAQLCRSEVLEMIRSLVCLPESDPPSLLLRALASGLMLNVYSGRFGSCPPEVVASILKTFGEVLNVEVGAPLRVLTERLSENEREKKSKNKTSEEIEKSEDELDKLFCDLSDSLNALHTILELLTNLCTCDDETNEWENLSNSDESDEMNDIEMDDDDTNECHKFLSIPCELHEAIVGQAFVQKILSYAVGPTKEICTTLQAHKRSQEILKRIHGVQYKSLLCVNNIVQCLDVEDMGGVDAMCQIWTDLARLAFKETDINDIQFLEASSGAIRAILQKLLENKTGLEFQHVALDDIQILINTAHQTNDTGTRINIIRILATLSSLVNKGNGDYLKIVKMIGVYLLEVSNKDAELHVSAEALDALFDVFAEDDLDPTAREIQLLEKLKSILSGLKRKINQKKRKSLGEHYPIVMTAKTNLIRFIKYKTNYYNQ